MSYIGLKEKYDHLKCLIHLAKADDNFTLAELTYIAWVAKRLDVSSSELQNLASESLPKEFYQSEDEKRQLFHQLLNLLKVDGFADNSELEELKKIGLLMGFSNSSLVTLIAKISNQPDQLLSEEELKEILQ